MLMPPEVEGKETGAEAGEEAVAALLEWSHAWYTKLMSL